MTADSAAEARSVRAELRVYRPRHAAPRRWPQAAVWAAGLAAALACYLRLADTRAVNTDGAAQALPAWDMLHGNLLLHSWAIVDVSFYTTELPEYMVVELVRGLSADVVHVAAAITYTLVILLAALLARSAATGRAALARVLVAVGIMVAPQLVQGINILVSQPDHIGTSVPVMLAWLILDRAQPRWYVPVAIAVTLGWAAIADELVLIIGVLPLAFVCLVRVIRAVAVERQELRTQWYDLALGGGALAGGAASRLALRLLSAAGGFGFQPTHGHLIRSIAELPRHFSIVGQGLLLLGGADFIGQRPGVGTGVLALHLVGVGLATVAVAVAALQFAGGRDRVDQVLVAGVAVNLAAYVVSTLAVEIFNTREMAPVLPLSAVLAGRLLADRIRLNKAALAASSVVLLGYMAGLGYELTTPPVRAQNQQIASWLEAHHFGSGLSGYWEGDVITLTTGARVRVAPVLVAGGKMAPYYHAAKRTWYDARQSSADFVLFGPAFAEYPGFYAYKAAVTTFGPPQHVYRVGRYEVLTYSRNLLTSLR